MKDALWNACVITYLCVCYFSPSILGLERNPECEMNAGYANAMFGMVVMGASLLIKIGYIVGFMIKRCTVNIVLLTEYT